MSQKRNFFFFFFFFQFFYVKAQEPKYGKSTCGLVVMCNNITYPNRTWLANRSQGITQQRTWCLKLVLSQVLSCSKRHYAVVIHTPTIGLLSSSWLHCKVDDNDILALPLAIQPSMLPSFVLVISVNKWVNKWINKWINKIPRHGEENKKQQ